MPQRKTTAFKPVKNAAKSYAEEGKFWLRGLPVANERLQEMLNEAFMAGADYQRKLDRSDSVHIAKVLGEMCGLLVRHDVCDTVNAGSAGLTVTPEGNTKERIAMLAGLRRALGEL